MFARTYTLIKATFSLINFAAEPNLVRRVLELAFREGDVEFIKCLVTEQTVEVHGESRV